MKNFIRKAIVKISLFLVLPLLTIQLFGRFVLNINIVEQVIVYIEEHKPDISTPPVFLPEYEQLNRFQHSSGLWGYEDGKTLKVVVEPKYDKAREFQEGRARVSKDGKWGFIDQRGHEVIKLKYSEVNPFFEGLARVKHRGDYYGFIDKSGKIIIDLQYPFATDFNKSKKAKVGKSVNKEFLFFAINTFGERISDYHEDENFLIPDD